MTNAETSTAATEAQMAALVLKDPAGDYFILPQMLVERGKVAADRRSELERLLAEEDVQGYAEPITWGVVAVGFATSLAASAVYGWLASGPPPKEWVQGTYGINL
jgi:hypothetical protein